jgi:hypothetical protein
MATKVVREKVVAFRLTPEQYEEFEKKIKDSAIVGVGSPGLMARKMALDFLLGEVKWANKKLRTTSTEVWLAENRKLTSAAA